MRWHHRHRSHRVPGRPNARAAAGAAALPNWHVRREVTSYLDELPDDVEIWVAMLGQVSFAFVIVRARLPEFLKNVVRALSSVQISQAGELQAKRR